MHAVAKAADVLVDAVEHHDGVVEAVAHDGEQGRNDVGRDLHLRPGIDAHNDDEHLSQGQDAHEGHLELIAHRDVQDDERDDHREGNSHGTRDVATPVGADGGDGERVVCDADLLRHGRSHSVCLDRVSLAGAHHEAVDVVDRGGLNDGVRLALVGESVAQLRLRHTGSVVERDLRTTEELDAEVKAAEQKARDGKHDKYERNSKEQVAMLDELNLMLEMATHPAHPPSRQRQRASLPLPCRL